MSSLPEVYFERNAILSALCFTICDYIYESSVKVSRSFHPKDDELYDEGYEDIIIIEYYGEQMTWHIPKKDMILFDWLPIDESYVWDGHSTEQKYACLKRIFRPME